MGLIEEFRAEAKCLPWKKSYMPKTDCTHSFGVSPINWLVPRAISDEVLEFVWNECCEIGHNTGAARDMLASLSLLFQDSKQISYFGDLEQVPNIAEVLTKLALIGCHSGRKLPDYDSGNLSVALRSGKVFVLGEGFVQTVHDTPLTLTVPSGVKAIDPSAFELPSTLAKDSGWDALRRMNLAGDKTLVHLYRCAYEVYGSKTAARLEAVCSSGRGLPLLHKLDSFSQDDAELPKFQQEAGGLIPYLFQETLLDMPTLRLLLAEEGLPPAKFKAQFGRVNDSAGNPIRKLVRYSTKKKVMNLLRKGYA